MPRNNSDEDKLLRNLRKLVAKSQSIHVDDVITIKGIVRSETTGRSISRIKVFANAPGAVSYTHLTLPTILLV